MVLDTISPPAVLQFDPSKRLCDPISPPPLSCSKRLHDNISPPPLCSVPLINTSPLLPSNTLLLCDLCKRLLPSFPLLQFCSVTLVRDYLIQSPLLPSHELLQCYFWKRLLDTISLPTLPCAQFTIILTVAQLPHSAPSLATGDGQMRLR